MDHKIHPIKERKYFTIIPNIIDDSDLTIYAIRLYLRIKRRAEEDGKCWESSRELARTCKMSRNNISKAKKELEDAGLIEITERKNPGGGKRYHEITVIDIWNKNIQHYHKD